MVLREVNMDLLPCLNVRMTISETSGSVSLWHSDQADHYLLCPPGENNSTKVRIICDI